MPCDLLLVDYAMPVMSGSECAEEARKLRPDLSILFMTGFVENDALRSLAELGCRILSKPFQYGDLAEAVHLASRPAAERRKVFSGARTPGVTLPLGNSPARPRHSSRFRVYRAAGTYRCPETTRPATLPDRACEHDVGRDGP